MRKNPKANSNSAINPKINPATISNLLVTLIFCSIRRKLKIKKAKKKGRAKILLPTKVEVKIK